MPEIPSSFRPDLKPSRRQAIWKAQQSGGAISGGRQGPQRPPSIPAAGPSAGPSAGQGTPATAQQPVPQPKPAPPLQNTGQLAPFQMKPFQMKPSPPSIPAAGQGTPETASGHLIKPFQQRPGPPITIGLDGRPQARPPQQPAPQPMQPSGGLTASPPAQNTGQLPPVQMQPTPAPEMAQANEVQAFLGSDPAANGGTGANFEYMQRGTDPGWRNPQEVQQTLTGYGYPPQQVEQAMQFLKANPPAGWGQGQQPSLQPRPASFGPSPMQNTGQLQPVPMQPMQPMQPTFGGGGTAVGPDGRPMVDSSPQSPWSTWRV